ncbi:nitric oxide synthase-interacting protein-like [Symsagittifera roscoffensis]|uniref:nitric oxide synthase-interacting protein-like n=1 Tax=Symsagittifera roscoffensis TaxID=84072 RepID=UPI00307B9292
MTRHGKNCTAGAVYTYHEKKKDTEASGYGTKKTRLGRDSIKDFDCCNLTLQTCKDPVITPDGFLYEREAILEYMLKQKRELARQMKAYEEYLTKQKKKEENDSMEKELKKIESFVSNESRIVSTSHHLNKNGSNKSNSNAANPNSCFWIPEISSKKSISETHLKKPAQQVTCPMSKKPLKIKNLIDVHFTPANKEDKSVSNSHAPKYMCALTNDALSNSTPCVVLRPSGQVITVEALDKLIRSEMLDPWKNVKLQESDVILLQRGASGFSGSGVELKAEKYAPSMTIS